MDEEEIQVIVIVEEIMMSIKIFLLVCYFYLRHIRSRRNRRIQRRARARYSMIARNPAQIDHMHALIHDTDPNFIQQLRMDRNTFARLCFLLENIGGLQRTRHVQISEQVAIFLSVLSRHKKNMVVKFDFKRSGYTISTHFNTVLKAVMKLHPILLSTPQPVGDDCMDDRWKWFKGCLGSLDGTYIVVRVPINKKAWYKNRKGDVYVNVLVVCDQNMQYVYVLSGWEGSAADSRVLRDVVSSPNGLRVPNGNCYLCDCGYRNGPGFLTPYRGVRYHLDEFGTGTSVPQNYRELFNLRHAKARNIIERSFGLLQQRWGIIRSRQFYPIKMQNRIIMVCCLLQNFIRSTIAVDPLEDEVPEYVVGQSHDQPDNDFVDVVESSQICTAWRDNLAQSMYN
ncbi:hypothetical protein DH2020_006258 [Rehmannia glutinosa]|uniref:DDE Tnp4 domain-containing protein n=1 Tax=Rehmannia glutinosa TaxID=99300 RepID=A0ABR0XIC1_REHGL